MRSGYEYPFLDLSSHIQYRNVDKPVRLDAAPMDLAAVAGVRPWSFALKGSLLDVAIGSRGTVALHRAVEQSPHGTLGHEERFLENAHFETTGGF